MSEPFLTTQIAAFVDEALQVADRKIIVSLGLVANAETILQATGFDVRGYTRILDNYGVRHAFKQHGNAAKEAARGQLAIVHADFLFLPLITSRPDRIFHDGKNRIGRDTLVFCKVINGIGYRHVEEIRPKGQLVATDSLRKKKGAWE